MQIDFAGIVEIASGAIAIVGSWVYVKVKLESHVNNSDRQFESLWKKTEEHDRLSADRREIVAARIGSIEAMVIKQGSQHEEVNKRFDRLEEKIDRLIERR